MYVVNDHIKNSDSISIKKILLMLVMGAIGPLAFAPLNWHMLIFISTIGFLYALLHSKTKTAFVYGFIYGLSYFGVGVYWVYISIYNFGNSTVLIAAGITLLFISVLALFPATLAFCFVISVRWLKCSVVIRSILLFPALFVIWEYLRSVLFSGFPWLLLGYSQTSSYLSGYAPIIGVYGLTGLVTFIGGLVLLFFLYKNIKLKISIIGLIALLYAGGWACNQVRWTHPVGKLTVSLVQGNIPEKQKWDPAYLPKILKTYQQLTQQSWQGNHVDLIIWPEAALPLLSVNNVQQITQTMRPLIRQAMLKNSSIVFGQPTYQPKAQKFYNSLIAVGKDNGLYHKRHLVPFGEYIPLARWLNRLLGFIDIPLSNLSAGKPHQPLLTVHGIPVATFICYEIIYPFLVNHDAKHSQLIIVINDDSWFGHSWAAVQQLQMAQFRALANRKYIAYVSNTGYTAIIDDKGNLQDVLPLNKTGALLGSVTLMQ